MPETLRLTDALKGYTYDQDKLLTPEETMTHPARFAMVEIENLYDDALRFEPIHRVLFGVDGDEIYDPQGLARLRTDLRAGAHADCWRIIGHTLHCESLDETRHLATGYGGPPSRTATKLYNFAALASWTGCGQRLHGGDRRFREGYSAEHQYRVFEHADWAASDFRCLHMAFLKRSSLQDASGARPNVSESWRGGWRAWLQRALAAGFVRQPLSAYKDASYRQGPLRTEEVQAFFPDDGGGRA